MRNEALTNTVKRAVEYALRLHLDEHNAMIVGDDNAVLNNVVNEVVAALTSRVSLDNLVFESLNRLQPGLVHQLSAKVVRTGDNVDVTELELLPKLDFRYQMFIKGQWVTCTYEEFQNGFAKNEQYVSAEAINPWPLPSPPGTFLGGDWTAHVIKVQREVGNAGQAELRDVPVKRIVHNVDGTLTAVVEWEDDRCGPTPKREAAVKLCQELGFSWGGQRWSGVMAQKVQLPQGEVQVVGTPKMVDTAAKLVAKGVAFESREDKYHQLASALGTDAMDTHEGRIDKAKKADRAINTLNNMGFQYVDHANGWMRKPTDGRW